MVTIKLRSPRELAPALRALTKGMDTAAVQAMRRTARWGATQVLQVSASTTPRPRATGTYERSWVVTKLVDGAALSNSSRHSIFVEVGRRPGRPPPVQAIVEWMFAKRIARGESVARRLWIAKRIARRIGLRGIKGRRILERTVPLLRKRMVLELSLEMRRAFERVAQRRG